MEKKHSLILDNEFIQYCKLNNIEDIEKEAKIIFKKGFDLIKYGSAPKLKIESNFVTPTTEVIRKITETEKIIKSNNIYDE